MHQLRRVSKDESVDYSGFFDETPKVGQRFSFTLRSGKCIVTTPVIDLSRGENKIFFKTQNSYYIINKLSETEPMNCY